MIWLLLRDLSLCKSNFISFSHQLQSLSPFLCVSLCWCSSFIPGMTNMFACASTPPLMALLNGTSPRAGRSLVLLPVSSDHGLALAFVSHLTDSFRSTSQLLAKCIWINSQFRCDETASKCFTKIQVFDICYVCFYQKSNRVLLASLSLYKPLCVFFMVTLSLSGKILQLGVCITFVFSLILVKRLISSLTALGQL